MKIKNKKITILGAGISGIGAAKLALHLGADVFLSDNEKIHSNNKLFKEIKFEMGSHSNKCYDCDLLIVSPGINLDNSFIKKFIKNNIPIISEIEFAFAFTSGKIISITGSNGKSTVVKLLEHIFELQYRNVLLGGNIGTSFSSNVLSELKRPLKNVIHILELSSFQLENINKFKSSISCILNITEDHINRHKTFNNYFKAKQNIIKNFTNDCSFIYNENDKRLKRVFGNNKLFTPFSIHNNKNNNDIFTNGQIVYDKKTNEKIVDFKKTNLIGNHNFENTMAAIQIAKLFNIKNRLISKGVKSFKPLEHRLEKLIYDDGITYINDSKATNIHSTICAINSSSNKTILILGGSSKSNVDYKAYLTTKLKMIEYIICYGEEGKKIYNSINKIFTIKYIYKFKDAINFAIKIKKPNYWILLSPACASFDQFNNFMDRGKKFKEIINTYYNEK